MSKNRGESRNSPKSEPTMSIARFQEGTWEAKNGSSPCIKSGEVIARTGVNSRAEALLALTVRGADEDRSRNMAMFLLRRDSCNPALRVGVVAGHPPRGVGVDRITGSQISIGNRSGDVISHFQSTLRGGIGQDNADALLV